jgi:CBS domain-containing protein
MEVSQMYVRDVMTRDVVTVTPLTPLKEAARLLVQHGISGLPVIVGFTVVGVVSERDFLFKEQGQPDSPRWLRWLLDPTPASDRLKLAAETVADAMTAPAVTIEPSATPAAAARTMLEAGVSRLPVVTGTRLVGIVTRADMVRAFVRPDAAIAAEINDDVLGRQLWLDRDVARASVADGNVVIEGMAPEQLDPEIVERLVRRVPGVISVAVRA